jgi:hypothetical protein
MSNSGNVANLSDMNEMNDIEAQMAALKARAAELKARNKNKISMKVSAKGAISIYGLQRMPVTLYAEQWERIIDICKSGDLGTFIADNEGTLTRKGDAPKVEAAPAKVSPAKASAKRKASKSGPSDADLAKIEALNKRVAKMPARDIFED